MQWLEKKANKEKTEKNITQWILYYHHILTNRLESYKKLTEDLEIAKKNNNKKEIRKIKNQLYSLQNRYYFDRYFYQLVENISQSDSATNFVSIVIGHHPSHKYRAEYLKKLIKEEEQKNSSK